MLLHYSVLNEFCKYYLRLRQMKRRGYKMTADRLSVLPESLIHLILSFLEMRYVVKTSLLSRKWKNLWTTIPYLDFDETTKSAVRTRNFINEALLRWKGTRILSFKITFGEAYDSSLCLCRDVDYWVGFAAEKKVEELNLVLLSYNCKMPGPVPFLPPCLNSCSSLTKLTLVGYSFRIHDLQHLDQLSNLMIIGRCTSDDFVSRLVSSSPNLEVLEAYLTGSHQTLDVRSSSLKKLALTTGLHDTSNYTELTVWAPNLESLEVAGQYSRCLLSNVPSLARAGLEFLDTCHLRVEDMLKQVLPVMQQVEELWLSLCCFKVLGVMKGKYSFSNVKKLKLCGGPIEPKDVVGINEYFPKVEKLQIVWKCDNRYTSFLKNLSQKHDIKEKIYSEQAEAKLLEPLLMQLRILEFCWHSCDATMLQTILQFIKFGLKHATMLQKVVIKTFAYNVDQLDVMTLAEQEVESLRRSFPIPAIEIYYY